MSFGFAGKFVARILKCCLGDYAETLFEESLGDLEKVSNIQKTHCLLWVSPLSIISIVDFVPR
jgi:hypothetical protein